MGADDQLGYGLELLVALKQPALHNVANGGTVDANGRMAAWAVAVGLGRCRVFGVNLENVDGLLPPAVAKAAAEECIEQIRHCSQLTAELSEQVENSENDFEAHLAVSQVLHARTDLWAGYVVIDEAYNEMPDCLPVQLIDAVLDGLRALDNQLMDEKYSLGVITQTCLLANWRDMLTEPYKSAPPWWLDGTLEKLAAA